MDGFSLHPRLAGDCVEVGALSLCRVLLMNDARYPWFILVPERPGLTEIHQLPAPERSLLIEESAALSSCLVSLYQPDKLNIAAIGNLVPQLHLHHVARYRSDQAWPNPVWGRLPPQPYETEIAEARVGSMQAALAGLLR
jgi:diadenosine tetraphosphate (Ap4A) HIT family hydrolase